MKKNYCYSCMRELPEGQSICSYCGNDNRIPHNESIQLPEGTVLNGKYMAGHMLGLGGFGITYIAIDLKMGIRVAIKEFFPRGIITRDVNTRQILVTNKAVNLQNFHKGIEAFQVEAQNIGKFDSPSIVHVRDFFLENNTAYIVMDYAEGPSLAQEIKHCGGQMEWDRVVGLMKPLIRAMDQLHRKNLIHRDIKPENIKVVTDPETGEERLVLLDFGAARSFASQNITKTYTQILTPGYAPYEQYLVRTHLGPFTDIYALCATMYAAITGEKPPAAPDRMVGADDIKPFSSYGLDVPEYVEKAIAHGLEKLYKNRTQTMRELLNELQEEIPEEPRDTDSILNDFSSNPLITGTGTGTGNNTSFDGGAEIWAASAENAVPVPIPEETLTGNTARIPEKNEISQENTIQPKLMSRKILLILIVSAVLAAGVFLIYRINSSHSETSELTKEISSESSLIDTGIPETPAAEILAAANTPEQTATTAETSVPSNTPEPTATLTETPAPSDTPEPTASTTETSAPSNTPEPTATTTDTPTHAVTEAPRDITMTTFKGIVNNPYDKSEKAGEMLYQQPSLKGTPLRSVINGTVVILTGERRPMNGIYWVKVIVNDGKGLTGWMRESAIVISQAIEAGNTFTFGSYEQDNNTENSSESIEWLVLEVEDENMLVISKYGLEIISGTGTDSEIKGSFSAVSEWLNEDFYNSAFNDYERARILPAEGSDDTFLYLLSSSDMEKYFPTQESQICELTAHAAANIGNDDEGSLKWWKPDDDDGTSAEKVVARPVFRMDISDLTNSGNIILATPTADPILTLTPIKVPDLVFTPPAGEESEETTDSPGQPKEDTSTSEDICPDEPEIPDIIQPVIEH